MLYRETGQYKTSYAADMAVFPILQDRIGIAVILRVAFVVIPALGNDSSSTSVMIPFLIFALAAIGLNILTGYTGLLSLGTGAFMGGRGLSPAYKLTTGFPQVNVVVWILASGFFSAAVGVVFGLPSLRIKGFYLAVATLAAQFFLQWCSSASVAHELQRFRLDRSAAADLVGIPVTGADATSLTRYLIVLSFVVVMTWIASNLVHGRIGRMWMAVRDMDMPRSDRHPLLRTKLLAFAVSSFYCGVAGAMMVFFWYGGAEADVLRHRPELSHPVHGDHRRARHADRLVFRRGAHLHPADRAAGDPRGVRAAAAGRDGRATDLRHRRAR